jgi:polygalacturonase
MAARLPTVGGDDGNWGQVLNDFLSTTHKSDGTLKDGSVTNSTIADGVVTLVKTSTAIQTTLGKADSALQTVDKTSVGLGNADNTSDLNKPVSTATQTALNAKVTSVVGQTGIITGRQIAADAALTATYIQQGALVYDVMDHGATGSFSGNDTTALQNAVDAVAAAGGGVVYLRPNKWFNTDGIKMRDSVSLVGGGLSNSGME